MAKRRKISGAKIAAGVGAGLAAVGAIAAGANYLYGKEGAKHRQKIKKLALQAKLEALKEMKKMQTVNRAVYQNVATEISKRYQVLQKIDKSEVAAMVKELQGHWDSISKQLIGKKKTASSKKSKSSKKRK